MSASGSRATSRVRGRRPWRSPPACSPTARGTRAGTRCCSRCRIARSRCSTRSALTRATGGVSSARPPTPDGRGATPGGCPTACWARSRTSLYDSPTARSSVRAAANRTTSRASGASISSARQTVDGPGPLSGRPLAVPTRPSFRPFSRVFSCIPAAGCRRWAGRDPGGCSRRGPRTPARRWAPLGLTSLPNPSSGTDASTLGDGRQLIVYNHTPKGRTPLNIALSRDGITWEAALVLESEPGEYSYPAVIQTTDGKVHVTYTWHRQRVRHVVIDPARLTSAAMPDGAWPRGPVGNE